MQRELAAAEDIDRADGDPLRQAAAPGRLSPDQYAVFGVLPDGQVGFIGPGVTQFVHIISVQSGDCDGCAAAIGTKKRGQREPTDTAHTWYLLDAGDIANRKRDMLRLPVGKPEFVFNQVGI